MGVGASGLNKSNLHHLTWRRRVTTHHACFESLNFLLPVFSYRSRIPFMTQIYLFSGSFPQRPALQHWAKGVPSTHAFHYGLHFFSADHDCTLACQQFLLNNLYSILFKKKNNHWYSISPWSFHNSKKCNASSRWLIFLNNGFHLLACISQHYNSTDQRREVRWAYTLFEVTYSCKVRWRRDHMSWTGGTDWPGAGGTGLEWACPSILSTK